MAYLKLALIPALLLAGSAHALYVTPSTPENFRTVGGQGYLSISPSDRSFANGIRSKISGGAARVALAGGMGADIPVAYKFAAGAAKAAASLAFGWPGVFLLAGGLAYQYFTDQDLVVDDGIWKKRYITTPIQYKMSGYTCTTEWLGSIDSAISSWLSCTASRGYGTLSINHVEGSKYYWDRMRVGSTVLERNDGTSDLFTQTGTQQELKIPVGQAEFENEMKLVPIPLGLPQEWPLPNYEWPVEDQPILNPTEEDPLNPEAVPLPQPLRVPLGDPIIVPNTDPQQYKSPVVDIVPSPTLDNPWRVDVQPKDVISESPEPLQPAPVPTTPPEGQTEQERQEQLDLCALHPDIVACSKPELDTPESDDLTEVEKSISFIHSPFSGSGACPAPVHVQGAGVDFKYDLVCDFMEGIKPLVLAFAALAAAMIILGVRSGGDQ